MTDKAKPQSRKLVRQTVGAVDKRLRKRGLTRAIRTAIDALMFDRCTREEACKRAGITERALYLGLAKSEVAAYWNEQLHVLRTGERARNISRLAELRDQDSNRAAAVKAVQVLEQLSDHAPQIHPGAATRPGITIVISSAPPAAAPGPIIDVTPRPLREDR